MGIRNWLDSVWREIKGNLFYDLIKGAVLLSAASLVPLGYALLTKLRRSAVDWYVFIGLFLLPVSLSSISGEESSGRGHR